MKDECLICGAPLTYLGNDKLMECALCHKKENSKMVCQNGHYVCNECHIGGMDSIIGICLAETSKNPIEIIQKLMALPSCHMHGPEHHIMVGSALLTAFKNSGGEIDLHTALIEMQSRGKKVPGEVGGQAVLGRQLSNSTPWHTERHGYDATLVTASRGWPATEKSGRYFTTGSWMLSLPSQCRMQAHSAVIDLLIDAMPYIVSPSGMMRSCASRKP